MKQDRKNAYKPFNSTETVSLGDLSLKSPMKTESLAMWTTLERASAKSWKCELAENKLRAEFTEFTAPQLWGPGAIVFLDQRLQLQIGWIMES